MDHVTIEPGVTRLCRFCKGTGQQTLDGRSDPNCGNCQWGDCDYGHEEQVFCDTCQGTGVLPFESRADWYARD